GVATTETAGGQPAPAQRAIAGKGGDCIGRAARREPAARRQESRGAELPAARDENQQLRDHLRSFPSARRSSSASRAKSRSIPLWRPIRTWSAPSWPASRSE